MRPNQKRRLGELTENEAKQVVQFGIEFRYLYNRCIRMRKTTIAVIAIVPEYVAALRRFDGYVDEKSMLELFLPEFKEIAYERGICGAHFRIIQELCKIVYGDKHKWRENEMFTFEWFGVCEELTAALKKKAKENDRMREFHGEYKMPPDM